MKKVLATIMTLLLIAVLSACNSNMSLGIGNLNFKKIHVCDYKGNCKDFTVTKWYESANGIEVKTVEAGSMFLSEGTYILLVDDCPFCD